MNQEIALDHAGSMDRVNVHVQYVAFPNPLGPQWVLISIF